jgi:hypothetical protein
MQAGAIISSPSSSERAARMANQIAVLAKYLEVELRQNRIDPWKEPKP